MDLTGSELPEEFSRADLLFFQWRGAWLEQIVTDRSVLAEELDFLGGAALRQDVLEGRRDAVPLAQGVKSVTDQVAGWSKKLRYGPHQQLLTIGRLFNDSFDPFSRRRAGLIAVVAGLTNPPPDDMFDKLDFNSEDGKGHVRITPDAVPKAPLQLSRVLRSRFQRRHDPRSIIEAALEVERLALTGELGWVGRKRRVRSDKKSHSGDPLSLCYSDAFLSEVSGRVGASRNAVKQVLRQARYELPAALYVF